MDILFLLTSFICAIIVPIIHYPLLQLKGFMFCFIIIIFALFVMAYMLLSVYKLRIAKINYLDSKRITSWNTGYEIKESKKPFVISLVIGLIFGILVYVKSIDVISSILLALACSFAILGWWLMGIKRYQRRLYDAGTFLLSHMGLIYNGNIEIFNGYSKGITSAKRDEKYLVLTILKNKNLSELKVEIPDEKIDEIDAFLKELDEHFSGENNEIQ